MIVVMQTLEADCQDSEATLCPGTRYSHATNQEDPTQDQLLSERNLKLPHHWHGQDQDPKVGKDIKRRGDDVVFYAVDATTLDGRVPIGTDWNADHEVYQQRGDEIENHEDNGGLHDPLEARHDENSVVQEENGDLDEENRECMEEAVIPQSLRGITRLASLAGIILLE